MCVNLGAFVFHTQNYVSFIKRRMKIFKSIINFFPHYVYFIIIVPGIAHRERT